MLKKLRIALAAEYESMTAFRDFVLDACQVTHLSEDVTNNIQQAVENVCKQIIEHGYKGMNPGTISISFQYGSHKIVVRITDYGYPFEIVASSSTTDEEVVTPVETDADLQAIYDAIDTVIYESTESGNTLTLIKRIIIDSDK